MRRTSLHIGLTTASTFAHGHRFRPIHSAAVDARCLARIAASRAYSHVTLVDGEATLANVRNAIDEAARELRRGDSFALTFSGHGLAGDTPDGFQQSWCLFDDVLLRYGPRGLDALLARFAAGVRVLVVANCCHSAGDDRPVATPPIAAEVVRIAACGASELTFAHPDATAPSAFVSRFMAALDAQDGGGFARFFEKLLHAGDASAMPRMEVGDAAGEAFLQAGPFC